MLDDSYFGPTGHTDRVRRAPSPGPSISSDSTTPAVVVATQHAQGALRKLSLSEFGPGSPAKPASSYGGDLSYLSVPQTQSQSQPQPQSTYGSRRTQKRTGGSSIASKSGASRQQERQRDEKGRSDAPLPRRTLTDVHQQVAQETAIRVITKAEVMDGCKIGVLLSMGDEQSEGAFLRLVVDHLNLQMRLRFGSSRPRTAPGSPGNGGAMGLGGGGWLFVLADGSPHAIGVEDDVVHTGRGYYGGGGGGGTMKPNVIYVTGSDEELVQRGALLISAKFIGRVFSPSFNNSDDFGSSNPLYLAQTSFHTSQHPDTTIQSTTGLGVELAPGTLWTALIRDLGETTYDDEALWDVVRKAARCPIDPLQPPEGSIGIDQMLTSARAKLQRVTPMQAFRELKAHGQDSQSALTLTTATHTTTRPSFAPVLLVDIRPKEQREKYGEIKGALVIERNVLEWRFDPRSDSRLPIADRYDIVVIVFCQQGYTSSLAAYSLQQLGLLNATDIIGGFEAWRLAGLPVETPEEIAESRFLAREQRSLASRAGSVV